MSDHRMKRTYFPGITDMVVVTDPAEIRTISNDSRFDRDIATASLIENWVDEAERRSWFLAEITKEV